ncbi:MAG: N-glycosylase/DNA lyase [Promethearchaeota archaeon CR_4]|nr:MAG: N-glycosylase/DNA lyase [Candidatus Lokiarchaeota archaeon CR_4]
MHDLLRSLESLKKVPEVRDTIARRQSEFKAMGGRDASDVFCELCFCILTANFNGERTLKMQDVIGKGFCTFDLQEMTLKLRELGYRFPNTRARYIHEAQQKRDALENARRTIRPEFELREWIVKNITGLGYKEASHFLRNIGYTDSAIIDFHIVDLLERQRYIERPKTLSKTRYLGIEGVLRAIGKRVGLNLSELDLYLWYMETGKILK